MDGALAIHLGWMNRLIKAANFCCLRWACCFCRGHVDDCSYSGFPDVLGHQSVSFAGATLFLEQKNTNYGSPDGGLVLAGISLFHRSEVDSIFEVLIGSDTEIVVVVQAVGVLTLVLIPYVILSKSKQERTAASVE